MWCTYKMLIKTNLLQLQNIKFTSLVNSKCDIKEEGSYEMFDIPEADIFLMASGCDDSCDSPIT